MRHFSSLLSAQSASNLKKNDQPLLAPTRAAALKTATPAKARFIRGIATAAIMLLTIPPITDAAEAGPGGGGGRGGGFGGHVGVGARGFAGRGGGWGFTGGPVGGARIGGRGIGSFGTTSGRSFTAPRAGVATARFSANHVAGTRVAGPGRIFGNRVITNTALQSRFGFARFHGRFFGSPWPWWWGGLAIGWIGPVLWPYVYYDFFDYVFWPYAYDDFWLYAYDDVYYGIYGPYAYGGPGPAFAAGPDVGIRARVANTTERRVASASGSEQRAAEVCSNGVSELTDWPIARISEVVQPTEAQRPALDELRVASQNAIDILKAGCPNDLPSTPTGRLAAMENRLKVMLQAVQMVRPPLERFYQLLSDEQKARLNVSPGGKSNAEEDQRALAKFCRERAPSATDLPLDRIAKVTQPTPPQRSALDELKDVSAKAAEGLKANCPIYAAVTPTGRIEAMEKRLEATHSAVTTVQPALAKFYDGLSDEQKARFNSLRADAAAGTYPPPGPVVVDQGRSPTGERGDSVSSSRDVTPPQYLDEE